MTTPTASTLLERLALLGAQRTVRTDRLAETVRALLAAFERSCEPGATATVQGHTLTRVSYKTKLGTTTSEWALFHAGNHCLLEREVGSTGFLHGDLDRPYKGPTRTDLVLFATCAKGFVEAFMRHAETAVQVLEASQEGVHEALAAAGVATDAPGDTAPRSALPVKRSVADLERAFLNAQREVWKARRRYELVDSESPDRLHLSFQLHQAEDEVMQAFEVLKVACAEEGRP